MVSLIQYKLAAVYIVLWNNRKYSLKWNAVFVILCVLRVTEDDTPVPKHVGVGTCQELCFTICN
jgi:hypothetical protein